MKDAKKSFSFVSNLAIVTLIALVFVAGVANVAIIMSQPLREAGFPGTLSMLFDYSKYASNHDARFTGQIISNSVAYLFMLAAIVLFTLSLALVKHDKGAKAKCAFIALFLFVPATLGLTSGIVNFFGEGLKTMLAIGGFNIALVLASVLATFVIDVAYLVLAILSLAKGLKIAVKVNNGVYDPKEEEKEESLKSKIEREAEHAKLLEDIRAIVKEELSKLDKVAILKELPVVYRYAEEKPAPAPVKVEKKPEPKPEPKPVEAEAEEESKKAAALRIPFIEKIVKADKEVQEKYNEIKNEILAYGAKSRVSVSGDTFRLHRKAYVKITLVGKMLKVYFALNPKDFVDSPIPVVDASDKIAYEEVPALLKVKSNLSVKRAKELTRLALEADGVSKEKEAENHNWVKDLKAEYRASKK